jgi:signal transduction histidine kinase
VASNGKLHEAGQASRVEPATFSIVPGQPLSGCWGLATHAGDLLVSNRDGVFVRQPDGGFAPVLVGLDVARLIMLGEGVCLAVGANQMAALRRDDSGAWRECCPRVPGVGYPSLMQLGARAAWFEVGANLVARVSFAEGRLHTELIRDFPWKDSRWIHVSILGDTVVLSGAEGGRVFYDERTGRLSEHSELEPMLAQLGPDWPARLHRESDDTLVVSHARGVSVYELKEGLWRQRANHWGVGECYVPQIQRLSDGTVFLSTGSEVYTLDLSVDAPPSRFAPRLVSATDQLTGLGLSQAADGLRVQGHPALRSGVVLRFFAGSHASRRAPGYELSRDGAAWERLSSSQLELGNLSAGRHELRLRLMDRQVPVGNVHSFVLFVAPHWSRTWQAWAMYVVVLAGALLLGARLLLARARRRAVRLQQMVQEKNTALELAMDQLAQETRMSATLAERNRLAAEIHDTLEQSLSALALQLATTATHPGCPETVRAGLSLAGNMVVFSRDEVRSVVWDLETPGVGEGGLLAALQRLLDLSLPSSVERSFSIEGEAARLPPQIEHHLLRIAQEAVANVVKHAAARSVALSLSFAPSHTTLQVRDDGRGFDYDEAAPAPMNHFGLRFLRGRAAKIGGTMEIHSKPGSGTTVSISVPRTPPPPP